MALAWALAASLLPALLGGRRSCAHARARQLGEIYPFGYISAMNPVKRLRQDAGVTQQELARRASTSQSTIAAYEAGNKSPTLNTLGRLAHCLGLELHCGFLPPLTREDRRSLAYHAAVARKLANDQTIVARAKRTLERQFCLHPDARTLLRLWTVWLDLPVPMLIERLRAPDLLARDMRQVSPFAGVLTAAERAEVLRQFEACEAA